MEAVAVAFLLVDRLGDEAPHAQADDEDALEEGGVDEGEIGLVVAAADARADPRAVVVELLYAVVTYRTVRATRRSVYVARYTTLRGDGKSVDVVLLLPRQPAHGA